MVACLGLSSNSAELYPAELLDDIKRSYKVDLADPGVIGLEDTARDLATGQERILRRLASKPQHRLVEGTVAETICRDCFQDENEGTARELAEDAVKAGRKPEPATHPVRQGPKSAATIHARVAAGKYKKCCGAAGGR